MAKFVADLLRHLPEIGVHRESWGIEFTESLAANREMRAGKHEHEFDSESYEDLACAFSGLRILKLRFS